jgi:hypothetical protein
MSGVASPAQPAAWGGRIFVCGVDWVEVADCMVSLVRFVDASSG